MTKLLVAIAFGAGAVLCFSNPGSAAERSAKMTTTADHSARPKARYKKRSARVYGYATRRGGYSYSYSDVINTYGLSRSIYGSTVRNGITFSRRNISTVHLAV